jgi:hypothetical protein
VIGEDEGLGTIKNGYFIRGHFQTRTYFQAVREMLPRDAFDLRSPSAWFRELCSESRALSPITCHVRRGDYLDNQNSFIGALSRDYFLDGLTLLRQDPAFENRELWIFSNDVSFVKQEFAGKLNGSVRWIEPPPHATEAESLVLLGSGGALVMSNSTFSWWAAAIGRPKRVVAPKKWFRTIDDPLNLLMPEWEQVDSKWL